ncbi:MAG: transposase [Bacillus sp. (in: firmicutes)]
MNPVIGLDVAKGESQVQMFLDKKMPYKNSVKVEHTVEGLKELHSYLLDLEHQAGMKPPVVLESTGHYHAPVIQFLEARYFLVKLLHPKS